MDKALVYEVNAWLKLGKYAQTLRATKLPNLKNIFDPCSNLKGLQLNVERVFLKLGVRIPPLQLICKEHVSNELLLYISFVHLWLYYFH